MEKVRWKPTAGTAEPDSMEKISEVEISVILPLYQTRDTVAELHRRLTAVLRIIAQSWEIVYVDDACPDGSWDIVTELAHRDPHVRGLALSHNVGQQKAVMAGIQYARGTTVIVMDADLQDPPEAIKPLIKRLRKGSSAVFATRRGRYESDSRLFTSRMFKRILSLLCGIPRDSGMFVAMDGTMVQRLLNFRSPRPYLVGMIGCTGLPVQSIPVKRESRHDGRSSYSSWKRVRKGCEYIFWTLIWRSGIERYIALRVQRDIPIRATIEGSIVSRKESPLS